MSNYLPQTLQSHPRSTIYLCTSVMELHGTDVLDAIHVRTGPELGGRTGYETSRRGIFAVGDVRAGSVKRVAITFGEGSVVMSAIWSHIND